MVQINWKEGIQKIKRDPAASWEYFRFISNLGEGQIGFIKGWLQISQVGIFLLLVKEYAPEFAPVVLTIVPAFLVTYVLGRAIFGWFLDKKFKLQHKSIEISNKRNYTLQNIVQMLNDIEQRLRRMEKEAF